VGYNIQAIAGGPNMGGFQDRKGNKSWNVFVVCSFDMMFTYVNVGWEGSAHDVESLDIMCLIRDFFFRTP